MSDDSSGGGSIVDTIIVGALLGFVIMVLAIALPILPYLEFIGRGVYAITTPESPFGKFFFWSFFFIVGYALYEGVKQFFESLFKDSTAMYMFLYGQCFLVIAFLWQFNVSIVAELFVKFIAWGISEPKEIAVWVVAGVAIILLGLSFKIESSQRG